MRRIATSLDGVFLIEPRVFADERGFFFEAYHEAGYREIGVTCRFVQDNHSRSVRNTLRGLHYQLRHPQAKLCRVIQGEVLDVVVDVRRRSPAFGAWASFVLSAENKRQVFVPRGFAHGFVVRSESAEFLYKCDDFYYPEDEMGVIWNDPALAIAWDVDAPVLSLKDRAYPRLAGVPADLLPPYFKEEQGY